MLSLLFTTLAILCFGLFNKYHTLNKADTLPKYDKAENYSIHNISTPFIVTNRVENGSTFYLKHSIKSNVEKLNCYIEFDSLRVRTNDNPNYPLYYIWKLKHNPEKCEYKEVLEGVM